MLTISQSAKVPHINITVATKHKNRSLLNINEHLKPKNTVVTEQLINFRTVN